MQQLRPLVRYVPCGRRSVRYTVWPPPSVTQINSTRLWSHFCVVPMDVSFPGRAQKKVVRGMD